MMPDDNFIAVSGGFDPVHPGHLEYIEAASCFGKVIVLLNSDEWLIRKKGYVFIPFADRKKILEGMRHVYCVLPAQDADDTVLVSLHMLKDTISYFGKGGDRWQNNTPEAVWCESYKISVLYGLGGMKIQSSSELVKNVRTH